MQVIPSACDACEPNQYEVSNICRGCVAHPCAEVCPKGAVKIVKGRSIIDQENVFAAENANLSAHMTQSQKKNVHVPKRAVSMRLKAIPGTRYYQQ